MTQKQLAASLALTSVPVNRTLKARQTEGLIARTKRSVRATDFAGLARVGDIDDSYLYLHRIGCTWGGPELTLYTAVGG